MTWNWSSAPQPVHIYTGQQLLCWPIPVKIYRTACLSSHARIVLLAQQHNWLVCICTRLPRLPFIPYNVLMLYNLYCSWMAFHWQMCCIYVGLKWPVYICYLVHQSLKAGQNSIATHSTYKFQKEWGGTLAAKACTCTAVSVLCPFMRWVGMGAISYH